MLSMLYFLFIAPLETLMGNILSWAYAGVGSYGWAVVILSLVVNLALLPIYAVAEGWQEDERRLRRKMAPKETEIRSVFKGQERHAMLRTLQRQSGYSQFLPLRASVGFLLQVPFFFAAYHLLSHADFLNGVSFWFLSDLGKADQLFTIGGVSINLLPIIMTLVNLVSAFVYTQQLTTRDKIQLYGLALVFLVALYQSPAALTLYWTLNNAFSLFKNMVYAHLGTEPKPVVGAHDAKKTEKGTGLYASSVLALCLAVFLYGPILFYASDPSLFSAPFETTLSGLMTAFWAALVVAVVVWLVTGRRFRERLALGVSFITLLSFLYIFVFTGDYGVLNGFFLEKTVSLHAWRSIFYDIAIFAGTALLFVLIVRFGKIRFLSGACSIIAASLLVMVFLEGAAMLARPETSSHVEKTPTLPEYNDTLLGFSQKERNVVVLVLDMFTGDHLGRMLKEDPNLKEALPGFVWYRDTLSVGSGTHLGLTAIHGGAAYTPFAINARGAHSYQDEYDRSHSVLSDFFSSRNTSVTWGGAVFSSAADIAKYTAVPPDVAVTHKQTIDDYFPYWKEKTGFVTTVSEEWPFLLMNGLFRAVPYSLRQFVYQDGKWHQGEIEGLNAALFTAKGFAFFDSLASASNTSSPRPTFKYLYTDASHEGKHFSPETGLPTGNFLPPATLRDGSAFGVIDPAHYYSELAVLRSIINWVEWMRSEGIYDNTRLIIAADHGGWDSQALQDVLGLVPHRGTRGEATVNPGLAYPLLMVKDFGAQGPLRISDDLMSIADVPELAVAGIGDLPEAQRGTLERSTSSDRERLYASLGLSASEFSLDRRILDFLTYRVHGSMFEKENWKLDE